MPQNQATDLTSRVKRDLAQLIARSELKAGDRLPPADELCEQFSVSRTVVREAIASLKAEGRLRSRRGSGVYVVDPAPDEGLFQFMALPQDIVGVLEFMEFRLGVEAEAAGLAAERRTESDLLLMEHAMNQIGREAMSAESDVKADLTFHRSIAHAANNARFLMFVDGMGKSLIPRGALGAGFSDDSRRSDFLDQITVEHLRIFDSIASRDADGARSAMRQHLEDGRRRYRKWALLNDQGLTQ